MRIGLDYRIADGKPCGMARYTTNVVGALARLDSSNEYLLFTHARGERQRMGLPANFHWVHVPLRLFSVEEQWKLPGLLSRHRLDVYHSLSFSMPLWRKCRSILTIYDLIHLVYPQQDSAKVAFYYKTVVSWCLRNVQGVVTVSENSKTDIHRALGVEDEKIHVVYGASDEVFAPMPKEKALAGAAAMGVTDPFILYVGNMRVHKNISVLIDSLASLAGDYPHLSLVICGEKNHSYGALVQRIRDRGLTDKVLFLEGISDQMLCALYNATQALVLPSFYEGFGLPPLEAMACGTPVVVADTPALKEITAEGALSFDPDDQTALSRHLRQILSRPGSREELKDRSFRRARDFSWARSAEKLLELYEQVTGSNTRTFPLGDARATDAQRQTQLGAMRSEELAAFDPSVLENGRVGILRFHPPGQVPAVSVIIPTLDGNRDGNLHVLIKDLCRQSLESFEILVVKGVKPQGKAINMGAEKAQGNILLIVDDDSRVPVADTFANLCAVVGNGGHVGMAGASVVISPESNRFQQRAARQFPRFNMPIVESLLESDMASHGCCAIPKGLFFQIGKEKENILRGLDPDLRDRIRRAGYKTVLVPRTWVYHPLSPTFLLLMKQFYRNGIGSAHAWIMDPKTVFQTHEKASLDGFVPRRGFGYRAFRFPLRLLAALMTLRGIRCMAYTSYAAGFIRGLVKYAFFKGNWGHDPI